MDEEGKRIPVAFFRSRGARRSALVAVDADYLTSQEVYLGRFEAVAEALQSGSGTTEACLVVGRELAKDGTSLPEALDAFRRVSRDVVGSDPEYADVEALCLAWSETTLGYLHALSCEDPLTGLSSLAHVRARLSELYRGELREPVRVQDAFALIVVALPARVTADANGEAVGRALRMARVGEEARTVFPTAESVGRLGHHRVVIVAARDDRLGRRVALLRTMLADLNADSAPQDSATVRIWIEGLPSTDGAAGQLLDELARS